MHSCIQQHYFYYSFQVNLAFIPMQPSLVLGFGFAVLLLVSSGIVVSQVESVTWFWMNLMNLIFSYYFIVFLVCIIILFLFVVDQYNCMLSCCTYVYVQGVSGYSSSSSISVYRDIPPYTERFSSFMGSLNILKYYSYSRFILAGRILKRNGWDRL